VDFVDGKYIYCYLVYMAAKTQKKRQVRGGKVNIASGGRKCGGSSERIEGGSEGESEQTIKGGEEKRYIMHVEPEQMGGKKGQKRKTRVNKYKCVGVSSTVLKSNIVCFFMEMLNTIKMYHWNTTSYSQHKATDELYSSLNDNIDHFIEVMLGKKQDRINKIDNHFRVYNLKSTKQLEKQINFYVTYLNNLHLCFHDKDSDLVNIRDEILADLNKFKYLLTLK
jgi:DNA-binding ferritin-like protein